MFSIWPNSGWWTSRKLIELQLLYVDVMLVPWRRTKYHWAQLIVSNVFNWTHENVAGSKQDLDARANNRNETCNCLNVRGNDDVRRRLVMVTVLVTVLCLVLRVSKFAWALGNWCACPFPCPFVSNRRKCTQPPPSFPTKTKAVDKQIKRDSKKPATLHPALRPPWNATR